MENENENEEEEATLPVSELFVSLQGEGSYTGHPCTFIRLFGCNFNCSWCDSRFSWDGKAETKITNMTIVELVSAADDFGAKVVEITGGEPMLHGEKTIDLMQSLIDEDYTVLLETNGSLDLSEVPNNVHIIMDAKCPSSGMHEKLDFQNFGHLANSDDVKFVCASEEDYQYAKNLILENNLHLFCNCILSPVTPGLDPKDLAEWVVRDTRLFGKRVWMQVQMHKTIWGNERKR